MQACIKKWTSAQRKYKVGLHLYIQRQIRVKTRESFGFFLLERRKSFEGAQPISSLGKIRVDIS